MRATLQGLLLSGMILVLNGCGEESSVNPNLTTLFLVDENGFSYGGVPYICDSMRDWDYTKSNGEFTFSEPDNCEFDFYGYNGTDFDDLRVPYNEYIYIVDSLDEGKNGIPYACDRFNVGNLNYTRDDGLWDGSFEYDADDYCIFYL